MENRPLMIVCATCEGQAWVIVPKAMVGGWSARIAQPCPDCHGRGRFPLVSGPGRGSRG